ncbi:hypothetical protein O181_031871 [Austropuccinia psidii MF-1]|uniref:Uncharacterized protein n=1 Tax=Austropuccinia psidii MF-1 TaxID=1389203 RepID=A0A9Q3D1C6_9BASI|nr:hypothetical protein [Austropuccinia psidii MF-1]
MMLSLFIELIVDFLPRVTSRAGQLRASSNSAPIINTISQAFDKALANPKGMALVVTDFHGVLAPKSQEVDEKFINNLQGLLQGLASSPKTSVYVVSSASFEKLNKLLGSVPNLGLAGEKGLFIRDPGASEPISILAPGHAQAELDFIERQITSHGFPKKSSALPKQYTKKFTYLKDESNSVAEVLNGVKANYHSSNNNNPQSSYFDVKIKAEAKNGPQIQVSHRHQKEDVIKHALEKLKETTDNQSQLSYVFGISLGDKPADEGMHRLMNQLGFFSVFVSNKNNPGDMSNSKVPAKMADPDRAEQTPNLEVPEEILNSKTSEQNSHPEGPGQNPKSKGSKKSQAKYTFNSYKDVHALFDSLSNVLKEKEKSTMMTFSLI